MWLPSEAFAAEPLWRIAQLAQPFARAPVSWRVIGPIGSDGLKALVDEATAQGFASELPDQRMRFYSPYATVPDRALLERPDQPPPQDSVAEALARHGVMLVRTIGDDGQLADGLIRRTRPARPGAAQDHRAAEARRAARAGRFGGLLGALRRGREGRQGQAQHIAVVAEWDTLYGRSLRREFRRQAHGGGLLRRALQLCARARRPDARPQRPTPPTRRPARKPPPGDKDGAAAPRRHLPRTRRRPEPVRLPAAARAADARTRPRVRRTSADGQGLRAIGVLGNDVHDKLLVLQALQP